MVGIRFLTLISCTITLLSGKWKAPHTDVEVVGDVALIAKPKALSHMLRNPYQVGRNLHCCCAKWSDPTRQQRQPVLFRQQKKVPVSEIDLPKRFTPQIED